MAHGNEANDRPRARRVKFAGTVIAVIQLDNGQQVRAKVHQLSATGGRPTHSGTARRIRTGELALSAWAYRGAEAGRNAGTNLGDQGMSAAVPLY